MTRLPLGSWTAPTDPTPGDPLDDTPTDVLVVGAGLNGLMTALGALDRGLSVRIVEAHPTLGRLASGRNTGKASALQGRQLTSIAGVAGRDAAVDYAVRQQQAVDTLRTLCDDLGVAWAGREAGLFAETIDDLDALKAERSIAAEAGLPTSLGARDDLGYAAAALTVPDQLALDPLALVQALAARARSQGARLHLGTRVRHLAPGQNGPRVTTVGGDTLHARRVIVATGAPIVARGGYFARLRAQRSYLVGFAGPRIEHPMMLSVGSPTWSVRDVPETQDPTYSLLVGGGGHGVGRTSSAYAGIDAICAWAAKAFPEHTPVAQWSAQDYLTIDHRPLVERVPAGAGSIVVVTGMNKWGLTNSVDVAARVVADLTGEAALPAASAGVAREVFGKGLAGLVRQNAEVGVAEAVGTARAARDLISPAQARCRAAGICTHLGGTLVYNDAEDSLDCPLHGSRFDPDGAVIEGYTSRRAPAIG